MSVIDAFELDSFVLLLRLLTTGMLSVTFTLVFTVSVTKLRLVDDAGIWGFASIIHGSERNIPEGQQFVWTQPLLGIYLAVVDVSAVE